MFEEIILSFVAGCMVTFLVAREYFSERLMKARIAKTIEVTPALSATKRLRTMMPLLQTVIHDFNKIMEELEEETERLQDIEEDISAGA